MQIAGCFSCESGDCRDEDREYLSTCEMCEQGKPDDAFDDEADDKICNECRAKAKMLS